MYMHTPINKTSVAAQSQVSWNNIAPGSFRERELQSHEALFREGDDAGLLYGVVEGVMCNYRILSDGRRQVVSFPYPGDLIGLGHSDTYHFCCEAVGRVRVRSIRKRALLHDPEAQTKIQNRLLEFANAELASMQEHHMLLGRKSAIEKVASFFLLLARKNAGTMVLSAEFQLPMTRTDIGDYLGLTIETVSRNITKLKVRGVIQLTEVHTIVVPDMERLETLAEGDF